MSDTLDDISLAKSDRIASLEGINQSITFRERAVMVLASLTIFSTVIASAIGIMIVSRLTISPSVVNANVTSLTRIVENMNTQISGLRLQIVALKGYEDDARTLLNVVEDTGAPVIGVDKNGRITLWSKGASEFFGKERNEVIGYSLLKTNIIPDGMKNLHNDSFNLAMQGDEPFTFATSCSVIAEGGVRKNVSINIWGVPHRMAIAIFTEKDNLKQEEGLGKIEGALIGYFDEILSKKAQVTSLKDLPFKEITSSRQKEIKP